MEVMCEIIESCDGHVTRPGFVKNTSCNYKSWIIYYFM